MATSTIQQEFGKPRQRITVTASNNVVIDENKSYRVGQVGILSVKGHTTAAISNANLFTFEANKAMTVSGATVPIGVGNEAWNITETGYGYLGGNGLVSRLASEKYFHVYLPLLFNE